MLTRKFSPFHTTTLKCRGSLKNPLFISFSLIVSKLLVLLIGHLVASDAGIDRNTDRHTHRPSTAIFAAHQELISTVWCLALLHNRHCMGLVANSR